MPSQQKPKPKPVPRKPNPAVRSESPDTVEEVRRPPKPKADNNTRTKGIVEDDDSEIEEIESPTAEKKKAPPEAGPSKLAAAKSAKPAKGRRSSTPEVEVVSPARPTKRKAADTDEEDSSKKKNKKAANGATGKNADKSPKARPKKNAAKPSTQAKGKAVVERDSDSEDAEPVQKKKKRKINIFSSTQPSTFNWGPISQVGFLSLFN